MLKSILFTLLVLTSSEHALASPALPAQFCQTYPSSPTCPPTAEACSFCHASPPSLNFYGEDIKKNAAGPVGSGLAAILKKIEGLDSDKDGANNLDEILKGGAPGNPAITPGAAASLVYDHELALKRLKSVYCGTSASYAEVKALQASANKKEYLRSEMSKCLNSQFWTKEALPRLADKKITPLAAVGFGGNVVIGDYRYDYWLFSYIMSGDRDVRELLSATYHIDAQGNKIEGTIPMEEGPTINGRIVIAGGEPLEPERRYGMMTTQWFLAVQTMFSVLPRNTASQVYREYLGMDIAKGEGLMPVPNEPRDVDNRNIAQPACAVCHSTLDPLSYSFSNYIGIETIRAFFLNSNGSYSPGRSTWEADGVILGQPVKDLGEWAEVARNSDAFKKNVAKMMFYQALNRAPLPSEGKEFEALWTGLPQEGYSVNKMLLRFIETNAFGGVKQ